MIIEEQWKWLCRRVEPSDTETRVSCKTPAVTEYGVNVFIRQAVVTFKESRPVRRFLLLVRLKEELLEVTT